MPHQNYLTDAYPSLNSGGSGTKFCRRIKICCWRTTIVYLARLVLLEFSSSLMWLNIIIY